jgi:hypothetical protein
LTQKSTNNMGNTEIKGDFSTEVLNDMEKWFLLCVFHHCGRQLTAIVKLRHAPHQWRSMVLSTSTFRTKPRRQQRKCLPKMFKSYLTLIRIRLDRAEGQAFRRAHAGRQWGV